MDNRNKEEIGLIEIVGIVEEGDGPINVEERNLAAAKSFVGQKIFLNIRQTIH